MEVLRCKIRLRETRVHTLQCPESVSCTSVDTESNRTLSTRTIEVEVEETEMERVNGYGPKYQGEKKKKKKSTSGYDC